MKQTSSRDLRNGLKYIDKSYEFMLEKGYEIVSSEGIDLGWQVVLKNPDLVVRIWRSRGEEDVSFRTGALPPEEFFSIGSVVYAATGEIIPLSSYNGLAKDLHKYLDRIETYFQGDQVKIQDNLRVAEKEYRETLIPVEYRETESLAEVVSPKEPKIIPILHYPLMGMILLLLFGALTTLYMVLLERLVSTLFLEPDSYGLFMGIVSLLLAIATMLLIRRRRKKS